MKKNVLTAVFAAVAMVAAGVSAHAGVVYSEDFNGLNAGTDTLDDSSPDWTGSDNYPVVEGGAVFTSNHLSVTTTATNFNFANWDDGVTGRSLLTVSFDVVDPGGMTGDAGLRLATSRDTSNGSLVGITGTALADNQIFRYDIVTNIGGTAVTYEDGVNSVAAASYDVWVNGVQTVDGASLVSNGAGDIDGFGLWARRPTAALLVDNIVVRDTAFVTAVPEPSSFALLGLAGLGFLRRKRSQ